MSSATVVLVCRTPVRVLPDVRIETYRWAGSASTCKADNLRPDGGKPLHADDAFLSRREVWALVGVQPLAQLSNQALLPSLGALRADLDLSYAELGWVVAAFGLTRLVVDLPAGSLAHRWNPRSVLIVALALSAGGSFAGLFAANAWQIAGVRLVIGVGSAIAQAMLLAWIVGGAGRTARGRVLARSEAFFSLSGLLIPTLGG